MKNYRIYQTPVLEIVLLNETDVITTSNPNAGNMFNDDIYKEEFSD